MSVQLSAYIQDVDAKENVITFYEQFGFENIDIKIGHIDTRP